MMPRAVRRAAAMTGLLLLHCAVAWAQGSRPKAQELEAGARANPQAAAGEEKSEPSAPESNAIRLRGLNKVTAHLSTLEAPLGAIMRFGTLEIIARRCWRSPPEEKPEHAAFLELWENKPGEGPQRIFMGWMFASSPALSALEHPVYDITVLACEHLDEPERSGQ